MTASRAAFVQRFTESRRAWQLGLLFVVLATGLLYLPSLSFDFVGWDDAAYITNNRDVRAPVLGEILSLSHRTLFDWTPLTTLSYALEFELFGLEPLVYHASNVILHALTVALVAVLLRRLGLARGEALLAALVFGLHPLNVESVAWVSSRKNLLACLFGVGFLLEFVAGRAVTALLLLLLALASKGTAVVLPLWAAACLRWCRPQVRHPRAWVALFLLAAILRGLLSVAAQADVVARTAVLGLGQRLALMGPVIATQARQFVFPSDLALFYSWAPASWSDAAVLLGWLTVAVIAAFFVNRGRQSTPVAITATLAATALLPTANLLPAPYLQADRYLHMALVGAAAAAVAVLKPLRRLHPAVPSLIVLAWCLFVAWPFSQQRLAVWRNGETLWTDAAAKTPDYPLTWANLGAYYRSSGDLDKSASAYRKGIEVDPGLRYDLALAFLGAGQREEAEIELRVLVSAVPGHAAGQGALGELLAADGRDAEAMEHLDAALRLNPSMSFARAARARALTHLGRLPEADAEFEGLRKQRGIPASVWADFAELRLRQQRPAEAAEIAERATAADPRVAQGWLQLARAELALERHDEAEAVLVRGARAAAEPSELWFELASLRARGGDRAGASEAAKEALARAGSTHPVWEAEAKRLAAGR